MKKVLVFVAIVIAIFSAIAFLTNKEEAEKTTGNPFGKDSLSSETIAQLDDPLYQNIVTPDQLDTLLKNKEDVTVYFYSPQCPHCVETTPVLMPVAEELEVKVHQYSVLEFEQGWRDYNIDSTPTLVHYKNGKETSRLVGEHTAEEFKAWFEKNK